jgi:hypothetical protein
MKNNKEEIWTVTRLAKKLGFSTSYISKQIRRGMPRSPLGALSWLHENSKRGMPGDSAAAYRGYEILDQFRPRSLDES